MFDNAITLIRVKGFDIKVDPSWLLIAALITWSLSQQVFPSMIANVSFEVYLGMAVIAMVLFFGSLLLHELAHAMTARRYGIKTEAITLFLFGGVALMRTEPAEPSQDISIAAAGPAMSLALAGGFGFLAAFVGHLNGPQPIAVLLAFLAQANLVLALFNLLPAFPLDGGRILRAIVWRRSGDLLRGTLVASRAGAALGYALMALGLFSLFQGAVVAGLWQILIAVFIVTTARAGYRAQLERMAFAERSVGDLMTPAPLVVTDAERTLASLADDIMLPRRVSFVPVLEDGVLLGFIDTEIMAGIDRDNWSSTKVGDVFAGLDPIYCLTPETPVETLLPLMANTRRRKFLVTDQSELVGIISLSDLLGYLGVFSTLRNRVPNKDAHRAPRRAGDTI